MSQPGIDIIGAGMDRDETLYIALGEILNIINIGNLIVDPELDEDDQSVVYDAIAKADEVYRGEDED